VLSEIDWTYPIHGLGWEPTDQLAGGVKQKKNAVRHGKYIGNCRKKKRSKLGHGNLLEMEKLSCRNIDRRDTVDRKLAWPSLCPANLCMKMQMSCVLRSGPIGLG